MSTSAELGVENLGESAGAVKLPRPACRVLVVDDDLLVRARLVGLLKACQYEVETAANGEQALAILDALRCHVLLTDWLMPEMDGLALCRHVRQRPPGDYVYTLMLTVRDDAQDILAGLAAGADDYLIKSAPIDEILARIEVGRRIALEFALADRPLPQDLGGWRRRLDRPLAAGSRSQRRGRSLAVLSCRLNAASSGAAGDELMRACVRRFAANLRRSDWLAQTGEDAFMVVLPGATAAGAQSVAGKLQRLVAPSPPSSPWEPAGFALEVKVTAVERRDGVDLVSRLLDRLRTSGGYFKRGDACT